MAKKYTIVDAHNHYIPREAAAKANAGGEVTSKGRGLNPNIGQRRVFDIEANLRHMEDCGVDMAVLALANWLGTGLPACQAINDGYAKLMKDYPGRFIPVAHVPYQDGAVALTELDRAINVLGLKGVTALTSIRDITLDSEAMFPLYEKVSQMDLPIVVHPTVKQPLWGGVKYDMSSSVSREYEIAKSVVEVMQGVLPRYPDLKFLFAHYGGGMPALKGRVMSWFRLPPEADVPEENREVPRTIREVEDFQVMKTFNKYFDKIYFDMAGFGGWMPIAKVALMAIKRNRLCFGTDYPFEFRRPGDLKAYIAAIKKLEIPDKEKESLLGGNVLKLFKVHR